MADGIPTYKTGIERLRMVASQRFNEVAKFSYVQTIGSGRPTIYVFVQPIGLVVSHKWNFSPTHWTINLMV